MSQRRDKNGEERTKSARSSGRAAAGGKTRAARRPKARPKGGRSR